MKPEETTKTKRLDPARGMTFLGAMASITLFSSLIEIEDDRIKIVMGGDPEDGMFHPEDTPRQTLPAFFATRTATGLVVSLLTKGADHELLEDGGVAITRGRIGKTTWRKSIEAFREKNKAFRESVLGHEGPEGDEGGDAVMEEEPSDDGKGFRLFEETDDGEKRILGPRLSPETTLVVLDWLKHQNRSDA